MKLFAAYQPNAPHELAKPWYCGPTEQAPSAINAVIEQAGIPMVIFVLNFLLFRIPASPAQIVGFIVTLMGVLESRQGGRYTVTDLSPSRLVAPFNVMLSVGDYDVNEHFEARALVELAVVVQVTTHPEILVPPHKIQETDKQW